MPSWAMHLAISKELSKNMNEKEKEEFTLGNILPDVNNSFLIPDVSKIIPHKITHCTNNNSYANVTEIENMLVNYEKICKELGEKIKHPIIYGYFSHLLTDYYWNYYTHVKKGVLKEEKVIGLYKNDKSIFYGDNEERRKMKVNDFNHFSKYLYENKIEKVHFDSEKLLEKTQEVPQISIQESDLDKVNRYFEQIEPKLNEIKGDYEIYTFEELQNCLKENVEFVKNIIKI